MAHLNHMNSNTNSKHLAQQRLQNEILHGRSILEQSEKNWGWSTPAGAIRWQRRVQILTSDDRSGPLKTLEIGAGTGTFSGEIANRYKDLTSIDIAPILIEKAKSKHPNVEFKVMDAHSLDFESDSFDLICGCSVLHHLDWSSALKEFLRVLRPNGKIIFSEPNLWNPQIFLQKNWPWLKEKMGDSPDEYAFSPLSIKRVLSDMGYVNIEVEPYEFLHPSTPKSIIGVVQVIEGFIEKSLLNNIAGSISIKAKKIV